MKLSFNIDFLHFFWFNIGWYSGEELFLIKLSVMETIKDCPSNKITFCSIFSIQVLKFIFAFGYSK